MKKKDIKRLEDLERKFDEVSIAVSALEQAQNNYSNVQNHIAELKEYMESGQWQADYEADERGEIPHTLKRGILSQDALYNLLETIATLGATNKKPASE